MLLPLWRIFIFRYHIQIKYYPARLPSPNKISFTESHILSIAPKLSFHKFCVIFAFHIGYKISVKCCLSLTLYPLNDIFWWIYSSATFDIMAKVMSYEMMKSFPWISSPTTYFCLGFLQRVIWGTISWNPNTDIGFVHCKRISGPKSS